MDKQKDSKKCEPMSEMSTKFAMHTDHYTFRDIHFKIKKQIHYKIKGGKHIEENLNYEMKGYNDLLQDH